MSSKIENQLSSKALVTDGYTRLEWLEAIERKAQQWTHRDNTRLKATQNLARMYLKNPAADPSKTPLPKIEKPSLMLQHLQERLSECLLICDGDLMQIVQPQMSPDFLTKFNLLNPVKLELHENQPLRMSYASSIKTTPTAALQELALLLPLECAIEVEFDAGMLSTAPPDFARHFVVIVGRFVQAIKYTDVNTLCSLAAEKVLAQILEGCTHVARLDIQAPIVNLSALRLACSMVTTLHMQNNIALTDADVKLFACRMVRLKEIPFAGCQGLSDLGLSYFLSECPYLLRVDFSKTAITGQFVPKFPMADKLTDLLLNDTQVTDEGLKAIAARLPQLCVLQLAGCKNISFEGVSLLAKRLLRASIDLKRCPQFTPGEKDALVSESYFASLQFEESDVKPKPMPCSEELLFEHFSLYLSSAFHDSDAIAYRRGDRCLYIRLNPTIDSIDSLVGRQGLVYRHLEWLLHRYEVHLELCYHALTVSAALHPIGQFLSRIFPYVTRLDIIPSPEVNEELIPRNIVSKWTLPKLRELTVDATSAAANIQASNLEVLQLVNPSQYEEDYFSKLPALYPKFQMLILLDGVGVMRQAAVVYKWSCFLSLAAFAAKLTSLDLSVCRDAPLDAIALVSARCPELISLNLAGLSISKESLDKSRNDLKKLKELNVANTSITDQHFERILDRQLTTLDLSYTNVTGKGLAMIENLPLLSKLQLNGCKGVNDEVLSQLKYSCDLIRHIEICGCKAVTELGLWTLLNAWKQLEEIKCDGCTVSDAVLKYLKNPRSKIEQLTLDLKDLKGDYALAIILLWHPNLISLELRGRGSADVLTNYCPRLKSLTLDALDSLGKLELPGVTISVR